MPPRRKTKPGTAKRQLPGAGEPDEENLKRDRL